MEKGLYSSAYEHDACGVGMVVNIHGNKSHELVDNALKVLENMRHRAASVPKPKHAHRRQPKNLLPTVVQGCGTKRYLHAHHALALLLATVSPEHAISADIASAAAGEEGREK